MGRTHVQEDKRTTYEYEPRGEHQVPKPLRDVRSILNKERVKKSIGMKKLFDRWHKIRSLVCVLISK